MTMITDSYDMMMIMMLLAVKRGVRMVVVVGNERTVIMEREHVSFVNKK